MIYTIASIVEGHGEVDAIPALLRRISTTTRIAKPVRFPKSKLITPSGLEHAALIASRNIRSGERGLLLLIIDADEHCAAALGPQLLKVLTASSYGFDCFVAVAVREFESWIVGGHPDIDLPNPETAGRLEDRIRKINGGNYRKTIDQSRMTRHIDPQRLAERSPSFARLFHRLKSLPG